MKLTAPLLCLAFLLAAVPSTAAVHEYGPDFQHFTLDVPDGWRTLSQENGVRFVSPDSKSVLTVTAGKCEGKTAEALVRKITRDLSGTGIQKLDDDTYLFFVTSENTQVKNILHAEGNVFTVASFAGEITQAEAIARSLLFKKD